MAAQDAPAIDFLFLRAPERTAGVPEGAAGQNGVGALQSELQDTLLQLKRALHVAMLGSCSASKEARQWLVNAIAGVELEDGATKRRRFTQFLPGGPKCRGAEHAPLGRALLQLLFDMAPSEVGALLAQEPSLLRHFFKADPKRVPLWFGHFSMEGMRRFKHGAAALAQFSLAHRAEMWDLLAWQGRHPQAPVSVAQRTHYFCELDVPRTLRHLIRDCPHFWSSQELRKSVEGGAAQLLALDSDFWTKELLRWLQDGGRSSQGSQLYALLCRCLERGPWRLHCQRLLHLLPQADLLTFAEDLLGGTPFVGGRRRASDEGGQPATASAAAAAAPAHPGAWIVFRAVSWQALDDLLLAAGLGCCLPQLLRLLQEDEMADERQEVQRLVTQLLQLDQPPARQAAAAAAHWRMRQELRQRMRQQQVEQPLRGGRLQPSGATAAAEEEEGAAAAAAAAAAAVVELHKFLLLHLFASAFLVQQLSSSGVPADARQLQRLLTGSGFACELQEPPTGGAGRTGSMHHRSSSGGGERKKRKERQREGKSTKKKGKKRKHKKEGSSKHKRRRRRHSRSGSSDEGSGSGSSSEDSEDERALADSGGRVDADWLTSADELGISQLQQWQLGGPPGEPHSPGSVGSSSMELLDAVIRATASAHATWLFG